MRATHIAIAIAIVMLAIVAWLSPAKAQNVGGTEFVEGQEYTISTTILCDHPDFNRAILSVDTFDEAKRMFMIYRMMPSVYGGPVCAWVLGGSSVRVTIIQNNSVIENVPQPNGQKVPIYIIEVEYEGRSGVVPGFITALKPSVPAGKAL